MVHSRTTSSSSQQDAYALLGVTNEASNVQIRQAYRSRLLELHPDKRAGEASGVELLSAVREAFYKLSDKTRRAEYDATRTESHTTPVVISDEVDESDFQAVEDQVNLHSYACRCGGAYLIESDELCKRSVDVVQCDTCSLAVRVTYDDRP